MSDLLFVYVTLMQGQRNELAGMVRASWMGRATMPGCLYDLGSYPAAKQDGAGAAGRVRGELYRLADPEGAIAELDRYEGFDPRAPEASEFVREWVEVGLESGGALQAWAYLYNRPVDELRLVPGGDYRAAVAARCQLPAVAR